MTHFDIDYLPRNDKHEFFQGFQDIPSIINAKNDEKRFNPTGLLKVYISSNL